MIVISSLSTKVGTSLFARLAGRVTDGASGGFSRASTVLKRWSGLVLLVVLMSSASIGRAQTFDTLDLLTQDQFRTLSENVAAAASYRGMVPAEPLGLVGFDVALALSSTTLDEDIFDLAIDGGYDLGQFVVPRLYLHKGLPFNIDIGATLTTVADTDIKLIGAELRYALLEGSVTTPAVAIRLAYSSLEGLDELSMSSAGAEMLISKGFLNFTPFAGAGVVRSTSKTNVASLDEEEFDQKRVFAGINVNLGINLGLEVDRTGDYTTYSARVGFRF